MQANPLSAADEFVSETFKGLKADGETLARKVFEECSFIGCGFSDSTLSQCRFIDCTFTNCNLSNVKIPDSRFSNVEFIDCKALGIDWTRASWPRIALGPSPVFRRSNINDSTLFGLQLEELVIEHCSAVGVDFRGGAFARGNFSHSDFRNAQFGKTNLSEVDFSGATGYSIDIFENKIEKAKFTRDEALSLLDSLDIELVD